MSDTRRSVRVPDANGRDVEIRRGEVDSRWRADRDERLRRARRDEKRIDRSEAYTSRRDDDVQIRPGSTVRTVQR